MCTMFENACCELALQDSLYHKKSSSFRDAYTSDKDVLRREVEREVERRDGEEKGNRKGKQTSPIRYPQTHAMTVSIWNLLQFMSGSR